MVRAYCELGFLDELFEETAKPSSVLDRVLSVDERLQQIESLAKFVFARCTLIIENLNEFQLRAQSNSYYKRMLKASQTGGSRILATTEVGNDHRLLPMPTVELLSRDSSRTNSTARRGLPISIDRYLTHALYLTTEKSCQVIPGDQRHNEFLGWKSFLGGTHPTHTLVIADQYLYSKSVKVSHNLKLLLEAFLQNLTDSDQVKIVLLLNMELRDRRSRLLDILGRHLRAVCPATCDVSVQMVNKENFHDRFILTDFALITSGHSFTYYNDSGTLKQLTTIRLAGVGTSHSSEYFAMRKKVIDELTKGSVAWDQAVTVVNSSS